MPLTWALCLLFTRTCPPFSSTACRISEYVTSCKAGSTKLLLHRGNNTSVSWGCCLRLPLLVIPEARSLLILPGSKFHAQGTQLAEPGLRLQEVFFPCSVFPPYFATCTVSERRFWWEVIPATTGSAHGLEPHLMGGV